MRRRVGLGGLWWVCVVSTGCVETNDAPGTITDPTVIFIDAFVVESSSTVSVPPFAPAAEGGRVESVPGDILRLTPRLFGPDGPIDATSLDAVWVRCGPFSCNFPDVPCPDVIEDDTPQCLLGTGAPFDFEIPHTPDTILGVNGGQTPPRQVFLMIAGVPGTGATAGDCLARARASEPVFDCLFATRTTRVGPRWHLIDYATSIDLSPTIVPAEAIPAEVLRQQPDHNPVLESVAVDITDPDGGVRSEILTPSPGARLTVAPGATVRFNAIVDEASLQDYFVLNTEEGEFSIRGEAIQSWRWSTTWGDLQTRGESGGSFNVWHARPREDPPETSAPSEDTAYVVLAITDQRKGAAWWWVAISVQ